MKNYTIPDSNSLYYLWVGFVSIVTKNILLQPKYSKEKFQKHTKTMLERYVLTVPQLNSETLTGGIPLPPSALPAEYCLLIFIILLTQRIYALCCRKFLTHNYSPGF